MPFEIRRAKKEDISEIVQLEIAGMGPIWERERIDHDAGSLREFIDKHFGEDRCWVAEEDGTILGFLHSTTYQDAISSTKICEIYTVVVHPEHFGEGIGAGLIEQERIAAAKDGTNMLKLEVLSGNQRAMKFYSKQGFRERKKILVSQFNDKNTMDKSQTDFPLIDWLMQNKDIKYNLASSSMPAPSLEELTVLDGSQLLQVDTGVTEELEREVRKSYDDDVEVLLTSGTQSANMLAYSVLLNDSDTVLVESPGYAPLGTAPKIIGRSVELLGRPYENAFIPELKEATSHADMAVITNPHNPSGVYMDTGSLEPLYKKIKKNNGILLVDEIYRDHMEKSTSAVELGDGVLVSSGLSKVYGLGGLRIGWLASKDRRSMERLRNAKPHMDPFNSVLSERTALALFENRSRILNKIRELTTDNLSTVKKWINNTDGIEWVEPARGIISFPKLNIGCTSLEFAKKARKKDVLVAPGEYFGMPGHVRLTFRLEPTELEDALTILSSIIDEL